MANRAEGSSFKIKAPLGSIRNEFIDDVTYLRVLNAMLTRPMPREAWDSTAGASNGPDLISQIRALFPVDGDLHEYIRCDRINFIDRDGKTCRPGVYQFAKRQAAKATA